MFERKLLEATTNLPGTVAIWIARAIRSGWFEIDSGSYMDRASGTVRPVVAAATMAGVWRNGQLLPGDDLWGTPSEPSEAVENFASYFDLVAEDAGIEVALETVDGALARRTRGAESMGPAA